MSDYMRKRVTLLLSFGAMTVLALTAGTNRAEAQGFRWPDVPENLQVLPGNTTGLELGQVMRGYATALGVRCSHCHVGEGNDLTEYDFPSDEKRNKQKARLMIEMVAALNDEYLPQLSDIEARARPALQVECKTCHRRNKRPEMLEDKMAATIESDGIDAAVAEYRELREQYYGGFTYDFSAGMLSGLGEEFSRAADDDSAIRMLQLEIEMNGESYSVLYTLGDIQLRASRIDEAIESFTKGRDMAPDEWKPFFETKLERLAGANE